MNNILQVCEFIQTLCVFYCICIKGLVGASDVMPIITAEELILPVQFEEYVFFFYIFIELIFVRAYQKGKICVES